MVILLGHSRGGHAPLMVKLRRDGWWGGWDYCLSFVCSIFVRAVRKSSETAIQYLRKKGKRQRFNLISSNRWRCSGIWQRTKNGDVIGHMVGSVAVVFTTGWLYGVYQVVGVVVIVIAGDH